MKIVPVDIDLSNYDVDRVGNHVIHHILECSASCHYKRGSQMELKLSAAVFPVFDILRVDFETKPSERQQVYNL